MRTSTGNGITIKFPDKIGFVFNPCIITIEGDNLSSVQLAVSGNDKDVSLAYDAYNGKCVIDIREYVKTFFFTEGVANIDYSATGTQLSDMAVLCQVTINARDGSNSILLSRLFSTLFIWGGLRPAEVFNATKHYTWFKNYPFTIGIYCPTTGYLTIRAVNGGTQKIANTDSNSIVNVGAANLSPSYKKYIIYDYDGFIESTTFDETFDLTFYDAVGEANELCVIDVDDSDSGIYLRWVDRHGFYRYWLFQQGTESRAVNTDGEYVRNNLWTWDDTFGYLGINGRRQGYSREDTIPICAAHVDSDTFDMLQDLTTSPIVDMWTGSGWVSVSAKTGTYTKTNQTYQDFIANIVRNDIPLQSL